VEEIKEIATLDELEAEYTKGIGEIVPSMEPQKEANLDNIRRFGDGVGDYNPLWRYEEHANKSRFGMLTAPPTFIYTVSFLGAAAAIYGNIHPARVPSSRFPMNYAGDELEFFRPIWLGDRIVVQEQVGGIIRKESKCLGPFLIFTGLVSYHNQRKELVATRKTSMARYANIGDRGISYNREQKADVLEEAPDALVYERERRGAETRYWEDVKDGEEIPPLKKGTYTVTELFLFTHGVVGTWRMPRAALEAEDSKDMGAAGRFDEEHARKRRNMPGQFDFGPQRICWMAQIVTDWMGDAGTLKKLDSQIRHPNLVGDTNTLYGSVVKTYIEDGEHLADLDVRNENQSGLATALARATVVLPSRA
jgi:acyl dehydratase